MCESLNEPGIKSSLKSNQLFFTHLFSIGKEREEFLFSCEHFPRSLNFFLISHLPTFLRENFLKSNPNLHENLSLDVRE